jgi:glycosyltransferase involved in cell wall biosynthesis
LILDGHNGLLVNPNESDIYNAIEKLVLDEVLRIKLGKNAINTVFDSFSKKEWDRKWLNIVDSM